MENIKNVEIVYFDESRIILQANGSGDTFIGEHANKVMHQMNRHFNYGNPSFIEKYEFIRSLHKNHYETPLDKSIDRGAYSMQYCLCTDGICKKLRMGACKGWTG